MSIRILLADDHTLLREGLRSLLEKQADLEVVGEAASGREAVGLNRRTQPHVVVMDVAMNDMNGIEATRRVMAERPAVRVLALSMHADKRFVADMFKAGAAGYMLKDGAAEELVAAIRAICNGGTYLSPGVAGSVVQDFLTPPRRADTPTALSLTPREREVLQLIAEGQSTKGIAKRLVVSAKTVETHRRRIMDKSGLHSVAGLTKLAVRERLTSVDQ